MRKLFLIFLLLSSKVFFADINKDNTWSTQSCTDTCTTSITVANNADRVLIGWFWQNTSTDDENGCTANGDALTRIGNLANGSGTIYAHLWMLKQPDVGTYNAICDGDGTTVPAAQTWVVYYGVDQTTTIRGSVGQSTNMDDPITHNYTTVAGDRLVLGSLVRSITCSGAFDGEVVLSDDQQVGGTGRLGCANEKIATGISTDISIDVSAAGIHASLGAVLIPATAATSNAAPVVEMDRRKR